MEHITVHPGNVPQLRRLLSNHPQVLVAADSADSALTIEQGKWIRRIYLDNPDVELSGLVELIDNNPLVCADSFSLPSPGATLALIGLGPLLRAGIIVEAPTGLFNFEVSEESLQRALADMHWPDGMLVDVGTMDAGTVLTGVFSVAVQTPEDESAFDSLYDNVYGSSFFVRKDETSDWSPELVRDKPFAKYRSHISWDQPHSLVTVRVLADRDGKCGAAQIVHAMNVMCGFEESLGIC